MIIINGNRFDELSARVSHGFNRHTVIIGNSIRTTPLEVFENQIDADRFQTALRRIPTGHHVEIRDKKVVDLGKKKRQ